MPKYPFGRLPSAIPPGSSYYLSNALIIAKRVALGLEDPVRIQSGEWKAGNPLHDWYERNEYTPVRIVQLRKEQKKPFFHEYIAFQLGNGKCFRIDRRQLPNERSPMDCTGEKGAEAYDTIEQIANLDDSIYNPSDCLVQISFNGDPIWLGRITYICRTISQHKRTGFYTVQKYNCYFYAQTILLYTSFFAHLRVGGQLWDDYQSNLYLAPNTRARLGGSDPVKRSGEPHRKGLYAYNGEPIPLMTRLYSLIGVPNVKVKWAHPSMMAESDLDDLREYLSNKIWAHGVRVEQYKLVLGCSAKEIQRDVKGAMNDIWGDTYESRLFLLDQKRRKSEIEEGTFGNHWLGDL
ncbi:unnamed protein product [Rhizoctonia solani]|uniref:Uncharacterized protein n=1 Tax=Rhizoctonia solani TaxID=456999 RepID=A0A8H3BUF9_9AGAM|nr:unnamed protein product [Rhizoctonia solani]